MNLQTAILLVWGNCLALGLVIYFAATRDPWLPVISCGGAALLATVLLLLGGS